MISAHLPQQLQVEYKGQRGRSSPCSRRQQRDLCVTMHREGDERLVWIPDTERVWVQARLLRSQGEGLQHGQAEVSLVSSGRKQIVDVVSVARAAGEDVDGSKKANSGGGMSLPFCNAFVGPLGLEDMSNLDHLHEPAILHNLRRRHCAALPYSYTGDVCIAVNPYRWLHHLYTEVMQYKLYRAHKKAPSSTYNTTV